MRPPRSCTPRSCTRLRARLATVALALFANAFALANPFPYAPFMVMTYGLTAKRDEVGFFAGFVLSAFMVGRLLSSYPLGLLSDARRRSALASPLIGEGAARGFDQAFRSPSP